MSDNALLLDALLAYAVQAPRNPDGTLTEQAVADLEKIAALAEDDEGGEEEEGQEPEESGE